MLHMRVTDFKEGRTVPVGFFIMLYGHEIFTHTVSTASTMASAWRNSESVEDRDTLLLTPPSFAGFHILGGFVIHSSLGSVFQIQP